MTKRGSHGSSKLSWKRYDSAKSWLEVNSGRYRLQAQLFTIALRETWRKSIQGKLIVCSRSTGPSRVAQKSPEYRPSDIDVAIQGVLLRQNLAVFLSFVLIGSAVAEPAEHWQNADPAVIAWADVASHELQTYGRSQRPTAVMIVQDDRVIARWGDVGRRVNVHSVRKSLLSALYGIAISEGRISLSSTLTQLGIDDKAPSLTDAEKQATVRDLLMARSGVYHPASYETSDIRQNRPARGSHAAGTFWFYNNWDFNALGTIYRQTTGEDIFQSFARRIARPIGMEDFSARDGQYVLEASSIHPAYPFTMSARDLARVGLLYLNGGRWEAAQVIPAAWIQESTTAYSQTDRTARYYGYLWWVLSSEEWGPGALMAPGYGGQMIVVIPSKRLVAVETVDLRQNAQGVRARSFLDLVRQIAAAAS